MSDRGTYHNKGPQRPSQKDNTKHVICLCTDVVGVVVMDPRISLEVVENRKIHSPGKNQIPVIQFVASQLNDWAFSAH
jgi:hypothetical protein